MSVDTAATLREEARTAQAVAERLSDPRDQSALRRLAASLVEIADRLERDARD